MSTALSALRTWCELRCFQLGLVQSRGVNPLYYPTASSRGTPGGGGGNGGPQKQEIALDDICVGSRFLLHWHKLLIGSDY